MNVKELIEEVENNLELVSYLNRFPKKNKKTQASYLESLNRLAYLLYLDGQEEMAKELLDRIIQVPFEDVYKRQKLIMEKKLPQIKIREWNEKPRTKLRFIKIGDIFCYQFSEEMFVFGQILGKVNVGHVIQFFDIFQACLLYTSRCV